MDDGSEDGLWRIRNSLYDLTDFIKIHPGGPDWLNLTKDTDITEAVEVHHLNQRKLEPYLNKYYVRDASTPKNMKLTFKPDGFYNTLRNRVDDKLQTMDLVMLKLKSKVCPRPNCCTPKRNSVQINQICFISDNNRFNVNSYVNTCNCFRQI